jgi:hypothetical protein
VTSIKANLVAYCSGYSHLSEILWNPMKIQTPKQPIMVHRQWFIDVYRISMVSQETFIDEMSLVSAQISMLKGWFFLKVIEHHR